MVNRDRVLRNYDETAKQIEKMGCGPPADVMRIQAWRKGPGEPKCQGTSILDQAHSPYTTLVDMIRVVRQLSITSVPWMAYEMKHQCITT